MANSQRLDDTDQSASDFESRINHREAIRTEIFVTQSENKLCRATLSDISLSGFKMTSRKSLDPQQPVFIRLPSIQSLSANIKWEGFKDYGCQFTRPLPKKIFEQLVSQLQKLEVAVD